jgi:multiple sugar transport system substrate-binding protein
MTGQPHRQPPLDPSSPSHTPPAIGAGGGTTRRAALRSVAALPSLAVWLAACGGPSGSVSSAPPKQQAPVVLRYAAPITPSPSNTFAEGLQKIVDTYNARGTPVTVRGEEPKPFAEGVLAQVAGGDPPDLVHSHPRDYLPYADAVRELDSLFKQEKKVVPDILPSVIDYWLRLGKHFGMPNNMSVQSVYFNRALFEKQGLKTPDQWEKEGSWTFDVYLDLARKLTTGTGDTKIWGAPWTTNTLDIQLGYIWPFGGDVWDKDAQHTLLDKKESLEAIQFQADLTAKYGASPTPDEAKILPRSTGGALATERGAMEVLTNDVIALFANATFPKGMAPMPKGRAGRIIRGVAVGLSIMKDGKHQDAAWDYATFQSGADGEQIMLDLHLTLPWRKSTVSSGSFSKGLLPWESAAYYSEALNKVRPTVYPVQFDPIRKLYATAYDQVRAGQQTAAQAIAAIKGQIDELLRQGAG